MSGNIQIKKLRNAELIKPPNRLREKAGTGGLDDRILERAQNALENSDADFAPIAREFLDMMTAAIADAKSGAATGEAAIEGIIYPAMQLKAHGTMFRYPLVSEIFNILVNFLETVSAADADVAEIAAAHGRAAGSVLAAQIRDDGGKTGKDLREALQDACHRYYKRLSNH